MRQRGGRVQNPHTHMRSCWQSVEMGRGLFAVGGWTGGGGFRASAFVFVQQMFVFFDGGGEVEPHRPQQIDIVEVRVAVENCGRGCCGS